MKKLMIKSLGWSRLLAAVIFVRPVNSLFGWAKRKVAPPIKVRLTRQSLMISLPASQGGRLHILPRPGGVSGLTRTFEVVMVGDGKYALKASPDDLALATYPSEPEAALALATLNKVLTGGLVWKWVFRLFLLWLGWLFVTSYMEVSQQAAGSTNPDIQGLGTTQGGAPNIPSGSAPFQSIPSAAAPGGGDMANYIYQQAVQAKEKAQKDALPPKAGVDNADSLAGFGLKGVDSKGSGEGCDPKLAFKVPQK